MSDEQVDLGLEVPDKLYFRIGEVSEIVGVETHVLRYWETEFKIRPQRTSSGQRRYQRKDVAQFLRIKQLVHDEGFTIAGARKVLSGDGDGPPSVDPHGIRKATERLAAVRAQIRDARERLGRALEIPPAPED